MTEKRLLLFLTSLPISDDEMEHASWVILDENNHIVQSVNRGNLNALSISSRCDVFVFIPSQDVLLTRVTLPKLSRQRLFQALPFALEEQLIDDIHELHFAIGEYQSDGTLPVAVISKQKIAAWLHFFEQRQITPHAFIPTIFAVPFVEDSWQINSYEGTSIARTGKFSGFACENDNLETLLELKLNEDPENKSIPVVTSQLSEQRLLENIANDIIRMPFIDLLQGMHQAKPQHNKIKQIWLLASGFAIAWIAIACISNVISYLILHRQVAHIETAIQTIYKRNFPEATSIVAPKERLTKKLHASSSFANENNFLTLLSALGKSLSEATGIRIVNLDYREKQVTVELSAATFDVLDDFKRRLSAQGLVIKQQNAAVAGSQVKATLLIRAGA